MVCYLRVKVMSYWRWLVCWCGCGADLVAGQASTWFLHFFLSPDDRSLPRPSAYPSSDISTLSNHAQKMGGAVLRSGTLQLHKALCLLATSSCWISACTWRAFLGRTFGNSACFHKPLFLAVCWLLHPPHSAHSRQALPRNWLAFWDGEPSD